jgi:hypothetical protein
MRQSSCSQEESVLKAVRTGMWEDALSDHVAGCDACKEIVQTSQWMQALAQASEKNLSLPDASLLWWRAHLSEKQGRVERGQELQEWMEIISATVISTGLAVWIGWNWMAIQATFSSLLTEPWPLLWTDAVAAMNTTPGVFTLGTVILSLVVIALGYSMLVPD